MKKNCDNCNKQNKKKMIQDCNTEGYPLYAECGNWEVKEKPKVTVKTRFSWFKNSKLN